MLSMRSLLCKSSENHYILYFTAKTNLESLHYGLLAVENSGSPCLAREPTHCPGANAGTRPSRETIPLVGEGQGAGMVHLLWRDVEGVVLGDFEGEVGIKGLIWYKINRPFHF